MNAAALTSQQICSPERGRGVILLLVESEKVGGRKTIRLFLLVVCLPAQEKLKAVEVIRAKNRPENWNAAELQWVPACLSSSSCCYLIICPSVSTQCINLSSCSVCLSVWLLLLTCRHMLPVNIKQLATMVNPYMVLWQKMDINQYNPLNLDGQGLLQGWTI